MIRYAPLALLMMPVAATAAPVALLCTFEGQTTDAKQEILLNEDTGTAAFKWSNGASGVRPATFLATSVSFMNLTIDRQTLAIVRQNDGVMVSQGKLPPTTAGKCAIDTTKRAF